MSQTVEMITGARLHFGFLAGARPAPGDTSDSEASSAWRSGRVFGGVGMMIDSPRIRLRVDATFPTAPTKDGGGHVAGPEGLPAEIVAPQPWRDRIGAVLKRFPVAPDASQRAFYRVVLQETIPPHVGLGAGTQLALAVAAATATLRGEPIDAQRLAQRAGRGLRSAIGLYGFLHGGLIVDAGKRPGDPVSPLAMRTALPESWAVVLACPSGSEGLSGQREQDAFAHLPPMPTDLTGRLCQLVLTGLMPAALQRSYFEFGEALFEFNRLVGKYFAPIQGGAYASEAAAEWVRFVRNRGVPAVGQSSWGPTLFAICPDGPTAERLAAATRDQPRWRDWSVAVTAPRNASAEGITATTS
ncbi:MAG TPA: beta-RFAP synthase [Planctomycetaceae bacterium]|nr:beta-RFAP synthase [Planctomycetaceae bacterium]